MMSLKNFVVHTMVGAAIVKVGIQIILTMLIIKITNIITNFIISISKIMLIKVGFLSYAGYKIAACSCSGFVAKFSLLSTQFSCLTAHRPLPCPCRPIFINWDRQVPPPLFSSIFSFFS